MGNYLQRLRSYTARKPVINAFIAAAIVAKTASAAIPTGDLHFTFAISDLYVPYFTAEENVEVLQNLQNFSAEIPITATHTRTTRPFHWTQNIPGVTGIVAPGFETNKTDQSRTFTLRPESGQSSTSGVVMPQSLELSRLFFTLSPDAFYQQQGYRAIAEKLDDANGQLIQSSYA